METKHTPGPWSLDGDGVRALVRDASGVIVAVRHRMPGHKNEANMRLIASAPELLEALLIMVDAITPLHNAHFPIEREVITDDDVDAAQQAMTLALAAIAKARGEAC